MIAFLRRFSLHYGIYRRYPFCSLRRATGPQCAEKRAAILGSAEMARVLTRNSRRAWGPTKEKAPPYGWGAAAFDVQ
jgi:hypothetical protein